MKSLPRASSARFLAAPTNGIAFKPVSSTPPMTPFRFIVAATVRSPTTAPTHGIDRRIFLERRAPPHRTRWFDIDMRSRVASAKPIEAHPFWDRSRVIVNRFQPRYVLIK
jgi:hypothetical protein